MRLTIALASLVWLAAMAAPAAQDPEPERTAIGHLPVANAELKKLVGIALEVSTTFREIAGDLERSPVIVYARYGRCSAVPACTEFISAAPPHIYLRATVDPFGKPPWKVTGLLAHELQHHGVRRTDRVRERVRRLLSRTRPAPLRRLRDGGGGRRRCPRRA